MDELLRMRTILEQVMTSKDPMADPERAQAIQTEINEFKNVLDSKKKENEDLFEIIKAKDQQLEEQAKLIKEKDAKIEKLKVSVKEKNKLRQTQREKNKELSKVRNELIMLKTQSQPKAKGEVDEMLKTQCEQLKDQIATKNISINNLKAEKKKLGSKVATLTKSTETLESKVKKLENDNFEEHKQRKYYEGLYKEEREKNIDMVSQLQKPKEQQQEIESKKHARPISANIHGRVVSATKLAKVEEEFEDLAEKEKPKVDQNEHTKPVSITLKDIKPAALAIRVRLQNNKVSDIKSILKSVSSLKDLESLFTSQFNLSNEDSHNVARYLFEKDSVNAVSQDKNMLITRLSEAIKSLTTLESKLDPYVIFSKDTENTEQEIFEKLTQGKDSIKEVVSEFINS